MCFVLVERRVMPADVRFSSVVTRNSVIATVLAPAGTAVATPRVEEPATRSAPARGAVADTCGAVAFPSGDAARGATVAASTLSSALTPAVIAPGGVTTEASDVR